MSVLKTIIAGAMLAGISLSAPTAMAGQTLAEAAQIKADADITVGLNGLVCDFCSIALNKTFNKNASVKATYVDLDSKSLSLVLQDGANLSDDDVIKLVKKAGYSVTEIIRKTR